MIDKVFWHENVTLFVDALNEIEQFRFARKERGDQDDGRIVSRKKNRASTGR